MAVKTVGQEFVILIIISIVAFSTLCSAQDYARVKGKTKNFFSWILNIFIGHWHIIIVIFKNHGVLIKKKEVFKKMGI